MDGNWSEARLVRALGDWASSDDALFRSLALRLRARIRDGHIPSGVRLPSERALAQALGVSRSTVIAAFDELRAQGLIASRQGSGTHITRAGVHRGARGDSRLETFSQHPAERAEIDLRSAALPGLAFVTETISQVSPDVLAGLIASHGYAPGGLPSLRAQISTYYEDLGLPTSPDQIMVTSGAQQGLRLVASTLLEEGGSVIVEDPTFRGAIETLRSLGAEVRTVPSGVDGMDLAALDRALGAKSAQMVFSQAAGNNPTGSIMPPQNRERLIAICQRHGVLLVEDAAVLDASTADEPATPIAGGSQVITMGSASKSFWGGLRVGWLRAEPTIVDQLVIAKGSEDLGTSLLAQVVVADLLSRIEEARDQRRHALRAGRQSALAALGEHLPSWKPVTPRAGASLWVKLPTDQAVAFSQFAGRQGVLIFPGTTFSARDGFNDHVRISFSGDTTVVRNGIEALGRSWLEFTHSA